MLRLKFRQLFSATGNYDDDFGYGAEMAAWLDPDDVNIDVISYENRNPKKVGGNRAGFFEKRVTKKVEFAEPPSPILRKSGSQGGGNFDDDFDVAVIFFFIFGNFLS